MFSEKEANFTGITGTTNEIFVNDFKQTSAININCSTKVIPPSAIVEENGFKLDSQFFYIVFEGKSQIPLLIGKLTDPHKAEPTPGKQSSCKIPDVENGFVEDAIFGEKISPGDMVPVDVTQVLVKCNTGFDLQNLALNQARNCKSYGWNDANFPKCQSNI